MVLVCGGAGYIGSHTVKVLRQAGIPHLVLDNLIKGHRAAALGSPLIVGDVGDKLFVEKVLVENGVTSVMHFAAHTEVGESVADPAKFWDNNVIAVINLLESMRATGVDQFIFSSTAAVYGEPQQIPIPESHPKNPTNPYGDTKLAVERILAAYGLAYGLRSVCLRYFNAAGADHEGLLGEDHTPESHLIPLVIQAALGRRDGITLFGSDYPTPDGTCIRDYIHVEDLAQAHVLAHQHLRNGGESKQYNLAHGIGYSNQEIVEAVKRVSGRNFEVRMGDRRPGDPARLIADSSAIRSELGWKPRWTELDDMVRHAYDWFAAHPDGYRSAH